MWLVDSSHGLAAEQLGSSELSVYSALSLTQGRRSPWRASGLSASFRFPDRIMLNIQKLFIIEAGC